ncbi:unnamed protein product, partial [Ixodes persulcatus]
IFSVELFLCRGTRRPAPFVYCRLKKRATERKGGGGGGG